MLSIIRMGKVKWIHKARGVERLHLVESCRLWQDAFIQERPGPLVLPLRQWGEPLPGGGGFQGSESMQWRSIALHRSLKFRRGRTALGKAQREGGVAGAGVPRVPCPKALSEIASAWRCDFVLGSKEAVPSPLVPPQG